MYYLQIKARGDGYGPQRWELNGERFGSYADAQRALEAKGPARSMYRVVESYTVVRYRVPRGTPEGRDAWREESE
jgi:hypothetical protein